MYLAHMLPKKPLDRCIPSCDTHTHHPALYTHAMYLMYIALIATNRAVEQMHPIYTHTYTHTNNHTHTNIHANKHTHTQTHAHFHTHIHIQLGFMRNYVPRFLRQGIYLCVCVYPCVCASLYLRVCVSACLCVSVRNYVARFPGQGIYV